MQSLYERLDAKLEAEANSGCLLWSGAVTAHGYGVIGLGDRSAGVGYVHRVAFERAHGSLQRGQQVCHRCDTPACCNPAHLFAGSPKANSDDKISKGRHARGEKQGNAKLTEDDVRIIRRDRRSGVAVARALDVSVMTISRVRRGINWKHVG